MSIRYKLFIAFSVVLALAVAFFVFATRAFSWRED